MIESRRTMRKHALVLLVYGLLACLSTWPLVRFFSTHVPGDGIDDPSLAWNLWWIKNRLVEQLNFDIFHVDWMFHPVDINLAFYTLTPLNGLNSTPFQLVTSLIVSSNIMLLSSYVLGGYGAFLLCYSLLHKSALSQTNSSSGSVLDNSTAIWYAALFGGIVYAFASAKLFYAALGQFNIASNHWVPFCILYLLRIHQHADWSWRWRNIILCGLFLIFQAWAELTYASFLIIFIVIYAAWILIRSLLSFRRQPTDHRQPPTDNPLTLIASFVLLALLFIVGISPFLAAMIPDMLREGDFFASGGGFADSFSADLAGYLVPTRLHPLLGEWVAGLHDVGLSNDVGQQIYLGYVLLGLVILGAAILFKKRFRTVEGWFWLINLLFFWLLTLGPKPLWFGRALPLAGPFALISQLPFFSGNRYPSRYVIMLLICAAVLAAYGLFWLLQRPRFRARQGLLVAAVSLVFFVEHISVPLPINLSTTPPIYEQIANTPGDFTVLELPTGWRNGAYVLGKSDKLIMMQQWYQSVHGKRRLGGNTSRNPWYKFEYFVNAPLLGDLIGLMNADLEHFADVVDAELDDIIAHSQENAPAVLDFLGVEYVTVRVEKSPDALLRLVDEALPLTLIDEWSGTDWKGDPETIRLYQVDDESRQPQLAGGERIYDLSGEMAPLYLAEGWSSLAGEDGIRYALRDQADLLLDVPSTAGTLSVEWVGNAPTLSLNGAPLAQIGELESGNGLNDLPQGRSQWALPEGVAIEPVDRLALHFDGPPIAFNELTKPSTTSGWSVGETGVSLAGDSAIVLMSAGLESGKFARIFVNGENVALGTVGYNLVALTSEGEVLDVAAFNTIADLAASERLAAWIEQWPTGTIIAGAVADAVDTHDATMLGDVAVNALRSVGVEQNMRGKYGWAHAFVGAVGAASGTAIERAQLIGIVKLAVGSPIDGAATFGGVTEVRFVEE